MKKTYLLLIAALFLTTAACSKKGGTTRLEPTTPIGPGVTPTPPPGGTVTPPVYTSGATVPFNINMSQFDEYTGRLPNNPTEFKINVDLNDVDSSAANAAYAGSVKISYREIDSNGNARYYEGRFYSGNTVSEARYNNFVQQGGSTWFKAVFEDVMGAIVIVADSIDEFGFWNGKIFFRNFQCGRNPWDPPCNAERPRRGWLVSAGPYDVTPFKVSPYTRINDPIDGSNYSIWRVNMSTRQYPEDYTQLGTFTGMNSEDALNQ